MTHSIDAPPSSLLRDRTAPHHNRVGYVELFFDLVFVFAVTQLSHHLLHHLSLEGAAQTGLLLLAVWTVWMWTAWVTNWLDSERTGPRAMVFGLMAAGLVMSAAIPDAFGEHGLAFAVAYAVMQVGRTLFMLYALRRGPANEFANFRRILVYVLVSAVLWIAGGSHEGDARWECWIAAIALETAGPWTSFGVPGLGRSTTADWTVNPEHMAERCGLFLIIALGESIIVTGGTFAELEWRPERWIAFAAALTGTISMWWVYFGLAAHVATEAFAHHEDPGSVARAAYTYGHLPIVMGIIVTAVSDEMILAHPLGHVEGKMLLATLLGPGLFLLGTGLFCWLLFRDLPVSAAVGVLVLIGLAPLSQHVSPVALSLAASGAVILVGAWESIASARELAAARRAHPGET
jgi:low temperature requirement protein LtrA